MEKRETGSSSAGAADRSKKNPFDKLTDIFSLFERDVPKDSRRTETETASARKRSLTKTKPILQLDLDDRDQESDDGTKGSRKLPKMKSNDNLLPSEDDFETGSDGEGVLQGKTATTHTQRYADQISVVPKLSHKKNRAEAQNATTEDDKPLPKVRKATLPTSTPKKKKRTEKTATTTSEDCVATIIEKKKVRATSVPTPLTTVNAAFFKILIGDMITESGSSNTGGSEKAAKPTTKTKIHGKKERPRPTEDVKPKTPKNKEKRVEVTSSPSPSSPPSASPEKYRYSLLSSASEEEEESEQENREYRKKRKEVHIKTPKIPEFNGDDYDGFMYKSENMHKQYKWQDSTSVFNTRDDDKRSRATRTVVVQTLEGNPKLQHYTEKHDRENGTNTETTRFDASNARPQQKKPQHPAQDKSSGGTASATSATA